MGKEHGQSSLLDIEKVSLGVLVSQRIQVDNARHSCCYQPRKSHQSIDTVEYATEAKIIIVGFSMGELVMFVVDQMPCDTIVKITEKEGHNGWPCSSKWSPGRDIQEVNKPSPGSSWF